MHTLVDNIVKDKNGNELHYIEAVGDSTEVKNLPTENIIDTSNFMASDTAGVWFFNEKTQRWIEA